ncbi:MAG: ATP-binding protein [Acidobacteria bacterium]|nr:ATP-binding protein [Acidobacteriota bacterium]
MRSFRRHLQRLNAARAVAVATLLVATFAVELVFLPGRPLRQLYALAAAAFGSILLYALLDRRHGESRALAILEVAGDMALVTLFVLATGGGLSPLTFLFAIPVVLAAALLGTGGGLAAALGAGATYGVLVARAALADTSGELSAGRLAYAATSHLVGFLVLGLLSGALADRLRRADAELVQQRDAVAALRALQSDIVESISAGLMTTDREGRVTFINPAGHRITGMDLSTVAGRPVAEVLGLAPRFLEEAAESLRAGQRVRIERAWRRPGDGEELYLGYTVSQLKGHAGEAVGWLLVFQDLTGLMALEQEVRIRERMAALGEMAAGMAHELRNPLAAISGCVQVIGRGPVGVEQRPLVEVAIQETERLNRIIRDFLQYARPGPFQAAPVELAGLIEETARLFRKSPDMSPRHRVVVERGPGGSWALADRDRMKQVFWNLAGNAIKAMPDGGTLTVRICGEGGDSVLLSFADEGHGMDTDALRRYFQPFEGAFREGSGLGAAIVYRIAEEHGGRVRVSSRPGRGSEIQLVLPAAEAPVLAGTGS